MKAMKLENEQRFHPGGNFTMNFQAKLLLVIASWVGFQGFMVASELPQVINVKNYEMAWFDEFDGDQLDTTKWTAAEEVRAKGNRWVPSLVSVADGKLKLGIKLSEDPKLRYDCGAVSTARGKNRRNPLYAFIDGYVEARCKLPARVDADYWAAFWIMAGNVAADQPDTRMGHEIDIMESFNLMSGKRHKAAFHWNGYGAQHNKDNIDLGDQPQLRDGAYHTYGLLWTTEYYGFYLDGKLVGKTDMLGLGKSGNGLTKSQGVCEKPGVILLSCESSAWPGNSAQWESKMNESDEFLVDYVRAYHLKGKK